SWCWRARARSPTGRTRGSSSASCRCTRASGRRARTPTRPRPRRRRAPPSGAQSAVEGSGGEGMRKKKHPEHVNHERWLVSYADFITLLFAFFVVMFSVSQVDSNKVGRFSESFSVAIGLPLGNASGMGALPGAKIAAGSEVIELPSSGLDE